MTKKDFLDNLKQLNVANQKGIGSIFDSSVGGSNVLSPYGGKWQTTPEIGMVSRIPHYGGIDVQTVTISTHGCNPYIAQHNAYL